MFINAGLFARTVKNYEGETRITLNQINGHYWRGAFDQAWVQFGGLRVGLQPSLFSFSRTGYTFMPGYASYMTTPAVCTPTESIISTFCRVSFHAWAPRSAYRLKIRR